MKRAMPFNGVSNSHPETIQSLRQRLALLHQLERKLKRQSAVLDAYRAEVISRRTLLGSYGRCCVSKSRLRRRRQFASVAALFPA